MEELIVIALILATCSGAGRARGGKNHVNTKRSRSIPALIAMEGQNYGQ